MREERTVYRVLVRKPDRKRPLGRARRRWENKKNLKKWDGIVRTLSARLELFNVKKGGTHR